MAPEQCAPRHLGPVGPPADVWGLGATLYRAATGKRPFEEGDPESLDPHARWPQLVVAPDRAPLPPVIVEPVLACLDPDPAERPRPAQLGDALEPVLRAQPKPRLSGLKPRWN
jgi:serine/threonine-protein kinase